MIPGMVHEEHDCDDELLYVMRRSSHQPSRGSVWRCDCGQLFIRGRWSGWWRRLRWFDRKGVQA